MGQGRSKLKIFNTLSQSLGFSRGGGGGQGDPAGQALFRVRSGSLDSISTAVSFGTGQGIQQGTISDSIDSFGTGQQHLQRAPSNSLDDLHHPVTNAAPLCREGGQTYTLLAADSLSLASGGSSDREIEVVRKETTALMTQSLPLEVERTVLQSHSHSKKRKSGSHVSRSHSMRQQRRREVEDVFFNEFTSAPDTKEKDDSSEKDSTLLLLSGEPPPPPRPILKASQELQDAATKLAGMAGLPAIQAPALLEKLTPEDLNDFISYVCATLGHSLHSSLEEKLQQQKVDPSSLPSSCRDNMATTSTAATVKHVRINEDGPSEDQRATLEQAGDESGGAPVIINKTRFEEKVQRRRRRRTRKERPNSLPSLWLKSEKEESHKEEEQEHSKSADTPPQCCSHHSEGREDPASKGGTTEGGTPPEHHHHGGRQRCQSEPHHRHRRKRPPRSKDAPVDVSLDDNCPGLPENRVRRSRHYHHHAVCEQCLQLGEGGEKWPASGQSKAGASPPNGGSRKERDDLKRNKSCGVLTLDDMKMAALILQKSAGCVDDDIQARLQTYGLHSSSRKQRKSKNKHRHLHSMEVVAALTREEQPSLKDDGNNVPALLEGGGGGEGGENRLLWNDLAYPSHTRSGRDSPATDMAVANLDLNSAKMREPMASVSDSYLNNLPPSVGSEAGEGQTVKHLYLHNHHHFHHIIHHSQPQ